MLVALSLSLGGIIKHTHDSMLGISFMILFPNYSLVHVVSLEDVWIVSFAGLMYC